MSPQIGRMDVEWHKNLRDITPMFNLRDITPNIFTSPIKHETVTAQKKNSDQAVVPASKVQPSGKGDAYYCEKDLIKTIESCVTLSYGCYYFPDVSSSESKCMLKACAVGTFFVRDSSDPKYLYTISVRTIRGPTSIRIAYEHGRFALDSDEKSRHQIPKFTSILDLIDYYVRLSAGKKSEQCRFLDRHGKTNLPILMSKPKLSSVPSLKHMCRTTVVRNLPAKNAQEVRSSVDELSMLPKPIRTYLKDYPYLY